MCDWIEVLLQQREPSSCMVPGVAQAVIRHAVPSGLDAAYTMRQPPNTPCQDSQTRTHRLHFVHQSLSVGESYYGNPDSAIAATVSISIKVGGGCRPSAVGDSDRRVNAKNNPQRYTSTGIFECVSTLTVSLPRTTAETPRCPCEAITIKSHLLASAASIIA